jgi:MFS family permease
MEPIKSTFHFSDFQLGILASSFLLVYAIAAYPLARLADKGIRKTVLVAGVMVWSVATFFTGTAHSFIELLLYRCVLGIGEASYATTLAPLISDYFPISLRSTALGFANAPLGIGTGLGYYIAGLSNKIFGGWRKAFFIVGVPGLILGFLAMFLREPEMGLGDGKISHNKQKPSLESVRILFSSKTLIYLIVSSIFLTFSLGGMLVWMAALLQRYYGFTTAGADIQGATAAGIGSLVGVCLGGILSDFWSRYSENGPIWVVILGFVLSAFFAFGVLIAQSQIEALICIGGVAFFQMATNGPLLAAMMNVTPPNLRSTCNAVYLFLIHIFGDALSPALIGYLSVQWGGLKNAMLLLPILTLISAFIAGGALKSYVSEKRKVIENF